MHAFSLAKALVNSGRVVYIITDEPPLGDVDFQSFDGSQSFKVRRIARRFPFFFLERIVAAWVLIDEVRPESILVSGKFSLWTGAVLKIIGQRKFITGILHGSEINPSNILFRWLTHFSIGKLDRLIVVSSFSRQLLPKRVLKNKSIIVIPNGIDINEFDGICVSSNRRLKGFPALLTIGNMTKRKGQHRVLRLLKSLTLAFPDIHYHCIGIPTKREDLIDLAKAEGIERFVTLHGKIPDRFEMLALAKTADVFIMLSENQPDGDVEGYGIAILEANAMGIPGIGAKGSGVEDAIKHSFNGYLVNGGSVEEVHDAVNRILNNKENMSRNSLEWAKMHSWDKIVKEYTDFIF